MNRLEPLSLISGGAQSEQGLDLASRSEAEALATPGPGGPPRRIALLGAFGVANLGNDGSLEAMVLMLRRLLPGAEIACICQTPEMVPAALGLTVMRWTREPLVNPVLQFLNRLMLGIPHKIVGPFRAFHLIRRYDRVILPGTGALDDFGERARGVPFVLFKWSVAARLAGVPMAMVSIGAGPIRGRLSRFLMLTAARLTSYLTVRDTNSRDFCERHGLRLSEGGVFPDLAFGLPIPERCARTSEGPASIAVGVMYYKGWSNADPAIYESYIEKVVRFVIELLDRGHGVRLTIGEHCDERAVRDVIAGVAASAGEAKAQRILYAPARNLNDVMAQMASVDVAVATRFHNVVCALMTGTPVISLSYAAKNDALLRDCGLEGFYDHVERFDPMWLDNRLEELIQRRDEFQARIEVQVGRYREALAQQERALLNRLLSREGR